MSGQIFTAIEAVAPIKLIAPTVLTSSNTVTFGAHANCGPYDSAIVRLQVAAFSAPATLSAILYESDKADDASLIPVTGANFGVISGSAQEQVFTAGVECKNYKQYLSLRLQPSASNTANPTIGVCADMIFAKPDNAPVVNNPSFWVTGQ
jgi:hypothetical protein